MTIIVEAHPEQTIVRLGGDVDLCTARHVESCVVPLVDHVRTRLVVDLTETTFLDCRGLAVLLAVRDSLRARKALMVLRGVRGSVRRIVLMSELADLLADHIDTVAGDRTARHLVLRPEVFTEPDPVITPEPHPMDSEISGRWHGSRKDLSVVWSGRRRGHDLEVHAPEPRGRDVADDPGSSTWNVCRAAVRARR
jgi:anti-anti-sigma factor